MIWLLGLSSTFLVVMTTERCFDEGDVKNSVALAQTLRATNQSPQNPQNLTMPEAIAKAHGLSSAGSIVWRGQVQDSCYGFVRVSAHVPDAAATVYRFDVDLSLQRLHPADDRTRQLMESLRGSDQGEGRALPSPAK